MHIIFVLFDRYVKNDRFSFKSFTMFYQQIETNSVLSVAFINFLAFMFIPLFFRYIIRTIHIICR